MRGEHLLVNVQETQLSLPSSASPSPPPSQASSLATQSPDRDIVAGNAASATRDPFRCGPGELHAPARQPNRSNQVRARYGCGCMRASMAFTSETALSCGCAYIVARGASAQLLTMLKLDHLRNAWQSTTVPPGHAAEAVTTESVKRCSPPRRRPQILESPGPDTWPTLAEAGSVWHNLARHGLILAECLPDVLEHGGRCVRHAHDWLPA